MGTFYVVRKNLQLWFGVDGRLIAQQNIVVLLKGIRFLGNLVHNDLSIENPGRTVPENSFVVLVALTIRLCVVHQGVMVHMLFVAQNGDPFQSRVNPLAILIKVQVVAD